MKPDPKILYKYRSLSGDDFNFTHNIFIKNELYFPHPDEFNDPFDCKVPPYLKDLTKEKLLEFAETPSKLEAEKIQEIEKHIKTTPLPELVKELEQNTKSHIEVGVLSLSEKNSDILMWGHYADSHKGICIGFDYCKLSSTFEKMCLVIRGDVEYPNDNEYPQWNPYDGNAMAQSDKVKDAIKKVYFTKARPWHYEKEWRVILPKQGGSLQKIDPNAIVSVHLGCQRSNSDKETVINWCLQREQKPKVYEMIKDDTCYSLKENEISY